MNEVRSVTGIPVPENFGARTGTPIVVDIDTANAYVLKSDGTVGAIGSSAGFDVVRDGGADPTGTLDSSSAFQSIIDRAKATSYTVLANNIVIVDAEVTVPPGVYRLNTGITTYSGVRLRGGGIGNTILNYYGSGAAITIDKVGSANLFGTEFQDFFLNDLGTGTYGIIGDDGTPLAIRCCGMWKVGVYGFGTNVYLNSSWTFSIENSFLVAAAEYNLHMLNATQLNARSTRFDVAGEDSVLIEHGSGSEETIGAKFDHCTLQSATKWGLRAHDCVNLMLLNCFVEANNQHATPDYGGVYFENGSGNRGKKFFITGGFFTPGSGTSGQTAIKIDRASDVTIDTQIRGGGFTKAVELGASVRRARIYGEITNGSVDYDEAATSVDLDYGPSTSVTARRLYAPDQSSGAHVALKSALVAGDQTAGLVALGSVDGRPAIQGFGTGSSFDLDINPVDGIVGVGGFAAGLTVTGSNFTFTRNDTAAFISTAGGNRLANLMPGSARGGRVCIVKKNSDDANTLTITPDGSDTIDGAASLVLTEAYEGVALQGYTGGYGVIART